MKNIFVFISIVLFTVVTFASGNRNRFMICKNTTRVYDSRTDFHFVFPVVVMMVDSKIEIIDLTNTSKVIHATITSLADYKVVFEEQSSGFKLIVDQDQPFKPGAEYGDVGYVSYVTYKGQRNYKINCMTNGDLGQLKRQ